MLHHTVTCFHHALLLSTLPTRRQLQHMLTEITKSAILLHPSTLVTLHSEIAWRLCDVDQCFVGADVLLSQSLFLRFLPRSRFLLRHGGRLLLRSGDRSVVVVVVLISVTI